MHNILCERTAYCILILFYLCTITWCSLDIAMCVYHVCLSFSTLSFAKKLQSGPWLKSVRLKTCFCQLLQETSAPPTTTSSPRRSANPQVTHDRRRRYANSQEAPKTNTLPAARKETYEDCTSEKKQNNCGTHSMILD